MILHRGTMCALLLLGVFAVTSMGTEAASMQFQLGTGYEYKLESTTLLNEPSSSNGLLGKDVGYQILATVTVGVLWHHPDNPNEKLLQIQLTSPQLYIKSRKAPEPEGFVPHSSNLELIKNTPFFAHWNAGQIEHVYMSEEEEDLSIRNLKKGVASLFQFQILDIVLTEKDASGRCISTYKSINPHTILKSKTNCVLGKSVPFISHPDKVMGTVVTSKREVKYIFSKDMSVIQNIKAEETHNMVIEMRKEAGGSIRAIQELFLLDTPVQIMSSNAITLEDSIQELEKRHQKRLDKQLLITQREANACLDECPTLQKILKEAHDHLKDENLGTSRSAAAFVKVLSYTRGAKKEELLKALNSKQNKDILTQLYDLIGATQTLASHEAAMKTLQFDEDNDLELIERYLWSLSLGSHPHIQVIRDVLKLAPRSYSNEKLSESLLLTLGALTNKFLKIPGNEQHKIGEEVRSLLMSELHNCSTDDCRLKYLRSFKNLGMKETVPTLLHYAVNGSKRTSVAAMKTLQSLPPELWTEDVLKAAESIYYQLKKQYDSSSRTLAIDILLDSKPNRKTLRELMVSLSAPVDNYYEVKQYLFQRLQQIIESDPELRTLVLSILQEEHKRLNNYNVMAQRGLSTALKRTFFSSPSGNGSLISVQEVAGGLLKRGIVDVVIDTQDHSRSIFTMGLFSMGLTSFISSDEQAESQELDEVAATAGLELTVLGVQIRPFIFFSGQSELMGHVWSGTGSERTSALQIIALLQDHLQYLPLQNGFTAELGLVGGASFDLSGQIQLSLWNRNAHSLVEKNAGVYVQGNMKIYSSFVRSQVEFNLATEARLNLVSDIDFYNNVALCLQLKSPDSTIKHNIYKVERIPGSKHRLRKAKYKVIHVSGKTYNLNRKNNDMCNLIFKDQ